MYLYPDNLKARSTLWLWQLRDVAVLAAGFLVSIFALARAGLFPPLICTCLYAFLTIRVEDASILDFLRHAVDFLFLRRQFFTWRERIEP